MTSPTHSQPGRSRVMGTRVLQLLHQQPVVLQFSALLERNRDVALAEAA